jgi:hypothetical protein
MDDKNYLELLPASEGRLSQSRLHLQSLSPTPVSRRVDVRRPVVKIIVLENVVNSNFSIIELKICLTMKSFDITTFCTFSYIVKGG